MALIDYIILKYNIKNNYRFKINLYFEVLV